MKTFTRGLKQIARNEFINAKADEAEKKGCVIVHLRPNGIGAVELVNVMTKRGLVATANGNVVTIAKAKAA